MNLFSETDLSCFQSSYRSARQRLLDTLVGIPYGLLVLQQAYRHPLPGPDNEPVYLDWVLLGQSATPERVLVIISGTHGVEGFTGAAIQSYWLPRLVEQLQKDAHLGIVFVHALNPWGFAWLRRYDHEGIDLNRNFIDFTKPLPENPDYSQLHEDLFVNASLPVHTVLEDYQARWGTEGFEAAITRGQYQHDHGLFYGGHSASWSRRTLEVAVDTHFLSAAQNIAVIDLHTGLGPFGHGEVINDHVPNTAGFRLARKWYGANARSAMLGESCSPPKTGLLDYFWHKLLGERGCFVTLEFGTYSLESLLVHSCEEQRYHTSLGATARKRDLSVASVQALHNFFYPAEQSWRELVLFRAGQIMGLAIQGMRE